MLCARLAQLASSPAFQYFELAPSELAHYPYCASQPVRATSSEVRHLIGLIGAPHALCPPRYSECASDLAQRVSPPYLANLAEVQALQPVRQVDCLEERPSQIPHCQSRLYPASY